MEMAVSSNRHVRKVRRLLEEQHRLSSVLEQHRRSSRACCLNCGAPDLVAEGEFVDGPHVQRIWKCGQCLLSQLERRLTEGEIAALEDDNRVYNVEGEDIEAKVREHSFILDLLHRFIQGSRLLEVGCARGYKLEAARRAGWQVEGIELSSNSCRFAREQLGLHVHSGTLDSYLPDHGFDAVIAWHVLEHVPSPTMFLNDSRDLLDSGGYLLVQVPSFDQYRPLPDWSTHTENFCQVHYWYFTADSLRNLLVKCGFEPELEYDDPNYKHLTFVARARG